MKKVYYSKTYEKDSNFTLQNGVVLNIDAPTPSDIKDLNELLWSLSQVAKYFGVADADVSVCTNYEPDYQYLYIKGLFEVGDVPDKIGCINFEFDTDDKDFEDEIK